MSESRTDKLLREFLEEQAENRAEGVTLKSLHEAVSRVANRQIADAARVDRHGRRIRKLENEVQRLSLNAEGPDWRPDPGEITGTHDLAVIKNAMKEERKRRDSDATWWQRKRWEVAIAAFSGAIVLMLGGAGTVAWFLITRALGGGR